MYKRQVKGSAIGAAVGFGLGGISCADGEVGLGLAEARCVAAYTAGGAAFGGLGSLATARPSLNIVDQGFNIRVTTDDGAFLFLQREPGTAVVEQISRGESTSGSRLLAEALEQTGGTPERIVLSNIINDETLNTFTSGGTAAESVPGQMTERTAALLDTQVVEIDFVVTPRGSVNIEAVFGP